MNDRMMRQFGALLLLMIVLSCAFKLFCPTQTVRPQSSVDIEKLTGYPPEPRVQSHSRAPVVFSQLNAAPERDTEPTKELTADGADILERLRDWARREPEAALKWGMQQPDGTNRNEVLTDACFQIGQTDPMRAATLAERLKLSGDAVLENLARQWASKDLTAAYKWMISQPENDYRDAFATGMAFELAQKEPVNAARFVLQEISSGSVQNEAVMMVLHQWALTDLSGATAWVKQFPEGELQNRALNELSGIARYRRSLAPSK